MALELLDGKISALAPASCDVEAEIARLSKKVSWYEGQAKECVRLALLYKIEVGRRLKIARGLLPHGKFLSWAHAEFGWTPRHVQNHMKLAEHANRVSQLPPDTSLRMALAAIRDASTGPPPRPASGASDKVRHICIAGEIQGGSVDKEVLIAEIKRMTGELGALESTWRTRLSSRNHRKLPSSIDISPLERN